MALILVSPQFLFFGGQEKCAIPQGIMVPAFYSGFNGLRLFQEGQNLAKNRPWHGHGNRFGSHAEARIHAPLVTGKVPSEARVTLSLPMGPQTFPIEDHGRS